MTTVEIISAPWCKRCHAIKPDVAKHCALAGATLTVVDYEEMEEADKANITSLPTIRMRLSPEAGWSVYNADTLEAWKVAIVSSAMKTDDDF